MTGHYQNIISSSAADPRVRRFAAPERIVWHSEEDGSVRNMDILLSPGSGQATLWARPGCVLAHGSTPSSIVLDFGREVYGGIQLIIGRAEKRVPVKLHVRLGESVSEVMGTPDNDHAIHDSVIEAAVSGATEFGNTGFRFVRIDTVDPGREVEIKEVRAVILMRDLEYAGSFKSSDPRLDDIWMTGAYTLHLCLQDYVWDGIKRDRLVWIGDLHPETVTAAAVFGKLDVVEKSLDLARDETPLPDFMNGTVAYSLWWIIIHDFWFRMYGDIDYLREQQAYMCPLLRQMAGYADDNGRENLPEWRFLDWPTSENKAALHAGLQALLCMAMDAGSRLAGILGDAETGSVCTDAAQRLRGYVPDPEGIKQVSALQVLAGMTDAADSNRTILSRNPFSGISTFYGYYVLQARALAEDIQGALDLIRTYWGGMLDAGATAFWEHFELEWLENASRIDELPRPGTRDIHADCGAFCFKGLRHSLCHGWASGPTAWLSEHVLGIRPLEPGMKRIAVSPRLGNLEWVRGTFPTLYGPAAVEHTRNNDGSIHTEVSVPDEVSPDIFNQRLCGRPGGRSMM